MIFNTETLQNLHESWNLREELAKKQALGPWMPPEIEAPSSIRHPYRAFYTNNVAFILMAGGLSSRLGSDVPKGMTPIPPSGKTLFEIFFRRAVGFQKLYQRWPHIAVMTSQDTDTPTRTFLSQHDYFGVPTENVSFFIQGSLPLLNEQGVSFEESGQIVGGPNGNGLLFDALQKSDIPLLWEKENVQAISVLNIDNPLMDPLLPSLFKPVLEGRKEASIAAILRASETEKAGILLSKNKKIHVVEYSEVPEEIRISRDEKGKLSFPLANISVFCIERDSIAKLSQLPMPLHFAKKIRKGKIIYKPEYFIFDTFPALEKVSLIHIDRKRYFSPIKAKTGEDSLEEAALAFSFLQQDQAKEKRITIEKTQDPATLDPAELYG